MIPFRNDKRDEYAVRYVEPLVNPPHAFTFESSKGEDIGVYNYTITLRVSELASVPNFYNYKKTFTIRILPC